MLRFLPNGRVERIDHGGEKKDPLALLFKPPNKEVHVNGHFQDYSSFFFFFSSFCSSDQSNVDFCHSLANLIAVILGCEPQSNHLWYNLFAADQLTGTYMPGFMVRKP